MSHPDRVLFPDQGITKLALAQYYERVCQWLLPHLQDRPLTLVRCPEGYNKDCFYQKHANDTVPDTIGRVKIPEEKGVSLYMIADSLPASHRARSDGRAGVAYVGSEAGWTRPS